MSEEEDELSEDELDALLSDLESRSDGDGGGASVDPETEGPEGEDLEALLQEADQEPAEPSAEPKVAERAASEAGPDLSDLDVADELPAETDEPAPNESAATEEADEKADDEEPTETPDGADASPADEGGRSNVGPYLWTAAKWTGYALPILACWWMVGAYLAHWISAGWLIALVATTFVVGVPKMLYDLADRRGRFRWWIAGASLVVVAILVAPMPEVAGEALTHFGHWPATAIAEVTGSPNGVLVDANAAAGEWFGRLLDPDMASAEGMRQLGQ